MSAPWLGFFRELFERVGGFTATTLDDHLTDTADAHDASAISNAPSGSLSATNVQSALNELQTDIDTRATSAALTAHIDDTSDAHDASAISNVPSGNLAATDVQAALNELQTDIDSRQARSTLTAKGDLYVATAAGTVDRLGVGPDGQVLTTDSTQAKGVKWATPASQVTSPLDLWNLGLSTSVGGNALTISLKQADGSTDPGADTAAVKLSFRSATATSGAYNQRSVTSALSLTVSSGSTLGHASGVAMYIYVYAIDNAGTVELAVSTSRFDEGTRVTTTAEGGAGGADSASAIYTPQRCNGSAAT